jgi:hypothetical protein
MASTPRIAWLVTLALATVVGCHGDGGDVVGSGTVTGNGTIVSEDRVVSGFTAVTHAGEGSVHITVGGQEALRIEVDENLLQHIITQVQGGVLQILTAANVDIVPTTTIQYFVTMMELESVVLSGVGSIEVPPLTVDQLSLTLSGVGDIECSGLDAVELQTVLSGVGNVHCDGQVDVQTVTVTGVGSYDAPNLASREATVTVGNSGSATVNVSERLEAMVTGNGSVTYVDSSGGGLVVQCTPASACTPAP